MCKLITKSIKLFSLSIALIITFTANNYAQKIANSSHASDKVTTGTLNRSLDPGAYYLVFSNHLSSKAAKNVEANVFVEYLNK